MLTRSVRMLLRVAVSGVALTWLCLHSAPLATTPEEPVLIHAAGVGNPYISFKDGLAIPASFTGSQAASAAMAAPGVKGLALASADFDEDGMPDLVASYSIGSAGLLSLHFGNVDSVYPNAPEAQKRRAEGKSVEAPFLPDAKVFETPERPDFVGAGDFDADGHWDVVAAKQGGSSLTLHRGDGAGGLLPPESILLLGAVTALATGDVNRRDGLEDVLVGVTTSTGPRLLVFEGPEGALRGKLEEIVLPDAATDIAAGWMDETPPIDIAVAAGKSLVIVAGRDRRLSWPENQRSQVGSAVLAVYALPFAVVSLVLGDFDVDGANELALLTDDGGLRLAPLEDLAGFAEAPPDPVERFAPAEVTGSRLIAAHVSSLAGKDIVVVRRDGRTISILSIPRSGAAAPRIGPRTTTFESADVTKAILPMRLNDDAPDDLACLSAGDAVLASLETSPMSLFPVTNTDDSGVGSLRHTIFVANVSGGADSIIFMIPGPGPHTIRPLTELPDLTETVTVDGTSQAGFSGTPLIEISGEMLAGEHGLVARAPGILLESLAINRFSAPGGSVVAAVSLEAGSDGSRIEGSHLNLDPNGLSYPGGEVAIRVESNGATIGGTTSAAKNLIYGSESPGTTFPNLWILGSAVNVRGNWIGLDASGADCPAGGLPGGFELTGSNSTVGGTTAGARNVMACGSDGFVGGSMNLVQGNYFGVIASGGAQLGTYDALITGRGSMNTIGGTSLSARNIISGYSNAQIYVGDGSAASDIVIQGNYLGTDQSGAVGLSCEIYDIIVREIPGTGLVERILIGGSSAGARNIIASCINGVHVWQATDVTIQGNYIGTNAAGTAAIKLTTSVLIDDTSRVSVLGNLISGGRGTGIEVRGPNTNTITIQGNRIGTDVSGLLPLGNGGDGISITEASANLIGGTFPGESNVIRFNGGAGISVSSGPSGAGGGTNEIRHNSISDNGGLGIDLNDDGVTPNDPNDMDLGGNESQNYPLLSLATTTSEEVRVVGTLDSKPNVTYALQFFASPSCDPSGYGEGETYLGTASVTTDGSGTVSFSRTFTQDVEAGQAVTAVAISPGGDSSEFSPCQGAFGVPPGSIGDLRFLDPSLIVWTAPPGGDLFHVYAGTFSTLSGLTTQAFDSCEAVVTQTPELEIPGESDPPPGVLLWLLATAEGPYGEGPVDPASDGPRKHDSTGICEDSCAHFICDTGAALTPACALCASIVCDKDPACCTSAWTSTCVQEVRTVCRSLLCPSSQGQCSHSLCNGGGPLAPGCDVPPLPLSCTAAICQVDPHCCQQTWDDACKEKVSSVCKYNCL